jgi:AcrR family transcriptional regulator
MNNKNNRRSQRTRQMLGDALVELMMEQGYNTVSIKNVIERANVKRSTFYATTRIRMNYSSASWIV